MPIKCVWDVASLGHEQYEAVFENDTVTPNIGDFRGHEFNGFILHVEHMIPGNITFQTITGNPLNMSLNIQALTFMKEFYPQDNVNGESGINFWPVKNQKSMPMCIEVSPSIFKPALKSLKVDYNVKMNKDPSIRNLIDEVRQITDTFIYIGRMYVKINTHPNFFLWFLLERRE